MNQERTARANRVAEAIMKMAEGPATRQQVVMCIRDALLVFDPLCLGHPTGSVAHQAREVIRATLDREGLRHDDLAARVRVSPNAVTQALSDRHALSTRTIDTYLDALGLEAVLFVRPKSPASQQENPTCPTR